MTHFTYLLGAGASFNSIPIVTEFEDRLQFHLDLLEGTRLGHETNRVHLDAYLDEVKDLKPKLQHYTSVDTYAKFLKLKGQEKEYHSLKNCLTMFFMIEQFVNLENIRLTFKSNLENKKPYRLDPRYNNFIVSLMNRPKWPSNLKVLSWNYDFQLQLAANSISYDLAKYYPCEYDETQVDLFHLNGIAGISRENQLILDRDTERSLDAVIRHWEDLTRGRGYNQYMKYAWESNLDFGPVEDHLKKSDVLVVIGYSFPFFNRDVDYKIFDLLQQGNSLKKIYFQNGILNGEFLYEQFNLKRPSPDDTRMMELLAPGPPPRETEVYIEQYKELDRFFIPREYQYQD
ncbi:MAG: hypothetical protein RIC35_25040 [Marinoscillum sp.]